MNASPAIATTSEALTFRAMNTEWWITAPAARQTLLDRVERLVHESEERYSRFRSTSLLSRLNVERSVEDAGMAALVSRALEIGRATGGAFDIRVGAAVIAAGYDRSFEQLPAVASDDRIAPPVAMLDVRVEGDTVLLDGVGIVDLGGIAKGWTIDRVAELFDDAGVTDYLVDGGGDIRAHGRDASGEAWAVGIGEDLAVRLADAAVCTSSTQRRRWATPAGAAHHIIDPARGQSAVEVVTNAAVIAADTATADALATAVIASPSALGAATALGAEVLLERNGAWEMTPGVEGWLA